MDRHMVIITTDERQERLASLLEGNRKTCTWETYREENSSCEKIYVLPIPISKLDKDKALKEKLKEELIKRKTAKQYVFGGLISQEWKVFLEEADIPYWDFMKLPEVVEGNGWITAEAVVAEVLALSPVSLRGQKMLVTGYGCCGRQIAEIFNNLEVQVTVAARREEVRKEVEADGLRSISFEELPETVGRMNTIINTVPNLVITEEVIHAMSRDALVIDIASRPGGTDFEAAERYGIKAKLALGLPGIYTTKSSAKLLKDAIFTYAPLKEVVREDRLWIFQIII